MKKQTLFKVFSIAMLSMSAMSCAIASLAWFKKAGGETNEHQAIDGEIGLRSYFYQGDGSLADPYEIVEPVHLYNLSRLQSLGVFPEKKYFKMGHETSPGVYQCLDGGVWADSLDMTGVSILPIGSEATPFVGDFVGRGLPIENLTIIGQPEDIGFFGYVAHEGEVDGLVLSNINIRSVGYVDDDSLINEIFDQDTYAEDVYGVDDAFETTGELARETSLAFYQYDNGGYSATSLTRWNGNGSTKCFTHVNNASMVVETTNEIFHKGYFLPTFPSGTNFTFSWKSSSPLLQLSSSLNLDINSDGKVDELIMMNLKPLSESEDFNDGLVNHVVQTRLYLMASIKLGGYTYSRVVQSYRLDFSSNMSDYDDGNYQVTVYCDYAMTSRESDFNTEYHHGNNIGFLAGHVDGKMTNSFVYKGTFDLNYNSTSPYTGNNGIYTESDTGLVGEISANVENVIDPNLAATTYGDQTPFKGSAGGQFCCGAG